MTDEELGESLQLIREAVLRGAPCSPPRTEAEITSASARLDALERERPNRRAAIEALRRAIERECRQEGLRLPARV